MSIKTIGKRPKSKENLKTISKKELKKYQKSTILLKSSKIICTELIIQYYNDSLAKHFEIKKIWELIAQEYY